MLKLIVFDCDGVMFDSKRANLAFYNSLLSHFGKGEMSPTEVDYVHMASVNDSVSHIFRHYESPSLDEVHDYREKISYEPFLEYMVMEKDLVEFLEAAQGKYHLAISTNRTNTMIPLLKSYNLDSYFEKVVTAQTASRPKPAPDGMLEILDFFNCSPDDAIFIGDSIMDLQQASACGVDLIAFKSKSLEAKYHVTSFMEIFKLPPLQTP
jgi:phosphoglycolate phosphatase